MGEFVIETTDLTKKYGDFTAVNELNLTVNAGEIFGLLGPNGAGKTTTILMLLGLTEPSAGSVRVLGFDPVRRPLSVKARAGYIPDQVGFYDELTAQENLMYIARLNGLGIVEARERITEALQKVGLDDLAEQPVKTFSRGMQQRLGVADVLIKKAQLIVMDEPTQGLDPEQAHEFLKLIRELADSGITILLSSHLLHQVQEVCDRVGLFYRGRMVLQGTVTELAQEVLGGGYHVRLHVNGLGQSLLHDLRKLPGVVGAHFQEPDMYTVIADHDIRSLAAETVIRVGGQLTALDLENLSLDDIYNAYFKEVHHETKTDPQ